MTRARYISFSALLLFSLLPFCLLGGCHLFQEDGITQVTEGGTLNLYNIDPLTLDPAVSAEMTSHQYLMQLFSGLVRLDDNLEPATDIAREWQVSDDGRTYTFYLRQDVSFHSGRKVKASDFKYSWERACDPATGSLTAVTYLGDIVGVSEVLSGQSKEISGVRVVGDYTLEVKIDQPESYFLPKLTYPTTFVVDSGNVESGREWWRNPNGTGPFKLAEWDENNRFVLERNPLYYGQKAAIDSVVFHLWGGVPMNMYETGEIDVTGVSLSYIDKVTDEAGPFYRELSVTPELSFYYIGFDTTRPPFDDINIRKAFSQAINKDKLASLVFRDMVETADGILPPGIPGFNVNLTGLDYDLNTAMRLIRESKYGSVSGLPPITITTAGWGGLIDQGLEAIISQWRENLGVEVKVRQLEPERFLYNLGEEKDEMYYTGWVADYPHPQDFLEILFHSKAENNYGKYSNPEVDALLEMAGVEADDELSFVEYQQAEQMLVDDSACIPLWFGQNYTLVKPYVEGYGVNPMGFTMLNTVSIKSD
ncbi:MAG: peptide ABC transporter substrate-binding protein [Dehalococcoidales bacterium]|nr:MAG: peptide ABC transporter substrate-binding protein [Dehalococcoidales bacterium]